MTEVLPQIKHNQWGPVVCMCLCVLVSVSLMPLCASIVWAGVCVYVFASCVCVLCVHCVSV